MRIWSVQEQSAHPPLALAVASVWTPARWRVSRQSGWVAHADEAMRGLFPNLPEMVEGPWGSLSRSKVFGAQEACSAMLDAMEGISLTEGGKIDPLLELGGYVWSIEPFSARVDAGKLALGGLLHAGMFSMDTQVALIEIEPDDRFFNGDKQECLRKLDALLALLDARMRQWIPTLTRLGDASKLESSELESCLGQARAMELSRATPPARRKAGRAPAL